MSTSLRFARSLRRDVDYIDLPTGHWPQFTKPRELARAILRAAELSS